MDLALNNLQRLIGHKPQPTYKHCAQLAGAASLLRGMTSPASVLDMTLNLLMVRLQ